MPYGRGTAMSNNQCQLDAACAGRFLGHAFSRIIRFECPGIDNLTPEAKKRIGMSRVHSGQAGPRGIRLTAGQVGFPLTCKLPNALTRLNPIMYIMLNKYQAPS